MFVSCFFLSFLLQYDKVLDNHGYFTVHGKKVSTKTRISLQACEQKHQIKKHIVYKSTTYLLRIFT